MAHATPDTPDPELGSELRADALDVLRDARQWRLTEQRWTAVARYVSTLAAAFRGGDVAAFRAAVYDLELAGPVRATGFGDPPVVEAPERVDEEMSELIRGLDGE